LRVRFRRAGRAVLPNLDYRRGRVMEMMKEIVEAAA
jgi:hypothetical protein